MKIRMRLKNKFEIEKLQKIELNENFDNL